LLSGNDTEFIGPHSDFPTQTSRVELEKLMFEPKVPQMEWVDFIIEKKDGTKIGWMPHYISSRNFGWVEIGFYLMPDERRKGYGTEATQIMVDYLFLTRDIPRIQAVTSIQNNSSQRLLEKAGFKREGTLRKALYVQGKWTDGCIYSILREEWREPRMLTKNNCKE